MAEVFFSSELQKLTGEESVRIDVVVFKDIVAALVSRYDALDEDQLFNMAVAVDGEIIHKPFLEKIAADSELHFLYRITGG
jgi:hypothetical protein